MSVNKAMLIGRLGKDPELRTTEAGKSCCTFSLATTEKYNDKETTTWHNIVAWGKQAEVMAQYLTKGQEVFIEGRISNRSYDDKEGNKKYTSEIIVQSFTFIGSKQSSGQSVTTQGSDDQDDLPF